MTDAETWAARAANPRLPLWTRVASYAEAHARPNGHCPLLTGQLHRSIDPTLSKGAISRAIARAVELGMLHPASSARCLVLTTTWAQPMCPATHRPPQ
jgi:hypothetical protein